MQCRFSKGAWLKDVGYFFNTPIAEVLLLKQHAGCCHMSTAGSDWYNFSTNSVHYTIIMYIIMLTLGMMLLLITCTLTKGRPLFPHTNQYHSLCFQTKDLQHLEVLATDLVTMDTLQLEHRLCYMTHCVVWVLPSQLHRCFLQPG